MFKTTQLSPYVFALTLSASAQVAAGGVFPPPHLHADAEFAASSPASGETADAWYHDSYAEQRVTKIDTEAKQVSPYPSMYYFINIRNYANDESERLQEFRDRGRVTPVEVVATPDTTEDAS